MLPVEAGAAFCGLAGVSVSVPISMNSAVRTKALDNRRTYARLRENEKKSLTFPAQKRNFSCKAVWHFTNRFVARWCTVVRYPTIALFF
jgi:hypothetical protein